MQNNYITQRLLLNALDVHDAEFIFKLVNTPEWINFIGDRNILTPVEAVAYVQKIIEDSSINYWVIRLQDSLIPIGIVSFIKRDYLDHYDIGFALFAKYTRQGYAMEAAEAVLIDAISNPVHTHILATTLELNRKAVKLLEKLSFRFSKKIETERSLLLVYSVAADQLSIDQITKAFFKGFTNSNRQPDLTEIKTICLPETVIIKKDGTSEEVYNLDAFIEPRQKILTDGTLTEFEERETYEETKISGNIAHRFSKYSKCGYLNARYFQGNGTKLFQFVKTKNGWKISSVIWEDEQ